MENWVSVPPGPNTYVLTRLMRGIRVKWSILQVSSPQQRRSARMPANTEVLERVGKPQNPTFAYLPKVVDRVVWGWY